MPSTTRTSTQSPEAKNDNEPRSAEHVGSFTCSTGNAQIFLTKDGARDFADTRAAQLASLLSILYGEGGQTFRNYNDDIQDNVMWLAAGIAQDLRNALDLIPFGGCNGGAA